MGTHPDELFTKLIIIGKKTIDKLVAKIHVFDLISNTNKKTSTFSSF